MKYGILETVSISPQLPNEIKINEGGVTKERILEAITILCSAKRCSMFYLLSPPCAPTSYYLLSQTTKWNLITFHFSSLRAEDQHHNNIRVPMPMVLGPVRCFCLLYSFPLQTRLYVFVMHEPVREEKERVIVFNIDPCSSACGEGEIPLHIDRLGHLSSY